MAIEQLNWRGAFDLWLSTKAPKTRQLYSSDLRSLARWLGEPAPLAAVRTLLGNGPGKAYELTVGFTAHLRAEGYAPATRNRRLATLKSAAKFANAIGLVGYRLPVKAEPLSHDLHGQIIPLDKLAQMMARAGVRMRAVLWLAYCPALRAGEIERLDVGDVDLTRRLVWFRGKARAERESHDLPEPAVDALRAWLEVRSAWLADVADPPGALFLSRKSHRRLERRSILRNVKMLGEAVGLHGIGVHSLRHTGITQAARALGGDYGAVQEFSRHVSLQTVGEYVHLAQGQRRRTVQAVGAALAEAGLRTEA